MAGDDAAARRELLAEVRELVADRLAARGEQLPLVGEREAPPRALDEPHADAPLQLLQPLRHRRRCDVERARGRRERVGARDGAEEAKVAGSQH